MTPHPNLSPFPCYTVRWDGVSSGIQVEGQTFHQAYLDSDGKLHEGGSQQYTPSKFALLAFIMDLHHIEKAHMDPPHKPFKVDVLTPNSTRTEYFLVDLGTTLNVRTDKHDFRYTYSTSGFDRHINSYRYTVKLPKKPVPIPHSVATGTQWSHPGSPLFSREDLEKCRISESTIPAEPTRSDPCQVLNTSGLK